MSSAMKTTLKKLVSGVGNLEILSNEVRYFCWPPRISLNFSPDDFLIDESWFHEIIITSEWVPKKWDSGLVSRLLIFIIETTMPKKPGQSKHTHK